MKAATNSLERALGILEMIERTPGGLRNADISRQMRIPKSTCSYIISRLERRGYLAREEETGRYRIGLSSVTLAHGALREVGVRSIAEPALYKLAGATGLSAGIGVLERGRVLVIDRVEGSEFVRDAVDVADGLPLRALPHRLRTDRDIGRQLPAHASALGKVLLAYLPTEDVIRLIAERGLPRLTPKTITSKARLLRELEAVRQQGYATSDEEQTVGVRAVAAPIYGAANLVSAGVSLNGSPAETPWREFEELIERVKAAAREISRRARFRPLPYGRGSETGTEPRP